MEKELISSEVLIEEKELRTDKCDHVVDIGGTVVLDMNKVSAQAEVEDEQVKSTRYRGKDRIKKGKIQVTEL